ncbi:CopG family transcriptional regulator [Enterobacter sp. CGMCC 5087]|uniref:CopG family transcriptional regulator n=1 Tax=Enterobacter sp. CGMCC 5087 TaxID=2183878 RepID=UPI000D674713|nr:CopG family transcriptional regulator [Enterobacter sp. CGMCC 5087]PWI77271.1 CopG family transcriptional regulator [Enterobacter sp. CGMCC 5087]
MALKLNVPTIPDGDKPATNTETARFIAGAIKKQGPKTKLVNFRITERYDSILDTEAARTGMSRTSVLKAALAAYENLDENQKNYWLLESAKNA